MRHPSELFIKSLLVRGKHDDDVVNTLSQYGLPTIPVDHASLYLADLMGSLGTIPDDLFESSSVNYLKEHKIHYLIHPDSVVSACTRLLDNNSIKRDVYVSLLGRVSAEDLSVHLLDAYGLDVSEETIKSFKHYYFDVDRMSIDDWAGILESLPGGDASYYASALDGGATVAAYRLGRELNVSIRDAVKEAVTGLYVSLHEIRHWSASPSKVKVLSDTVSALAKAHNVISTADAELASVAHELRQFKLARNNTKPASLNALTGGNHSGSGKRDAS
jgi:hypothetical protein